jgi:P27 family predicted phage terminase small subunit
MRADRINAHEPKAPGGIPDPPSHLDEYGGEGFRQIATATNQLGLASPVDRDAMAVYAGAYRRWRHAMDDVAKTGQIIKGSHGGRVANPSIGIAERAERVMVGILATFGLTPSDRSRLKAQEQTDDPLDRFLRESV